MNIKFYVETGYEKGLLVSVEDAQSLMGILSRAEHVDSSGYGDEMEFTRRKELLLKQFRVLRDPKLTELPLPPVPVADVAPAAPEPTEAPTQIVHNSADF